MRRLLIAVVVAAPLALVLGASPAEAQLGNEHIESFAVDVTIEPDGDLRVAEQITYDFGVVPHHGIIRDIPYRFSYTRDHDRVTPISDTLVGATDDTPHQASESRGAHAVSLKIGDPDRTITGRHTYEIRYRVEGAINRFRDHDELYWNATGNGWTVPIDQVSVVVRAPAQITDVACFAGYAGSTLPCERSRAIGKTARFGATGLAAGQGLTSVVAMPPGTIVPAPEPILAERWTIQRAFSASPRTVGAGAAVLALGLGLIMWGLWKVGRDRRFIGAEVDAAYGTGGPYEPVPVGHRTPIVVEFTPPEGLRPGQVGTLIDETANPVDVTATIVDLAVRGYLRIDEVERPRLFHKGDWRLERLKEPDDTLRPYERKLMRALFKGEETAPLLSDLRNHFASDLGSVEQSLYTDAVENGWFRRRPDKVRLLWTVLAWLAFGVAVGVFVLLVVTTSYGIAGAALVLVALAFIATARKMPARTAKGTAALRRTLGFRRFIMESEKERARFAEQQHLFSEYLPYAIVFGAVDRWAKAFEGLGAQPADLGWYVGTRPFVYADFSHAVIDFSTVTAGTLTSTPAGSGSSGFGGGGSSGGGFGGGGGSSW